MPRLATLAEVKKVVGEACGIAPVFLTLAECMDGSMTRLFEDEKHTALHLKTFDASCSAWVLKSAVRMS